MTLHVHKQLHASPETLLSTLRQRIWITQGRPKVKRTTRKCVICQKQHVSQKMGPLPEEKVIPSPPFSHISIDFVGPLYVKERASVKKTNLCVFTWASSHAVHLELTNSLSKDDSSFYKPLVAWQAAEAYAIQCGQTTQKHLKPQVMKSRSCIPNARHKASPCGTHWIKVESSLSPNSAQFYKQGKF